MFKKFKLCCLFVLVGSMLCSFSGISALATVENDTSGIVVDEPEEEIMPSDKEIVFITARVGEVCQVKAGVNLRDDADMSARSLAYLTQGSWIRPSWEIPTADDGYTWNCVEQLFVSSSNDVTFGKTGYIREQYVNWAISGRIANGKLIVG